LLKDDEDSDSDEEGGLFGQAGSSKSASWRKTILRKLSLALAIYGLFVMILCLGTNLFFTAASH